MAPRKDRSATTTTPAHEPLENEVVAEGGEEEERVEETVPTASSQGHNTLEEVARRHLPTWHILRKR